MCCPEGEKKEKKSGQQKPINHDLAGLCEPVKNIRTKWALVGTFQLCVWPDPIQRAHRDLRGRALKDTLNWAVHRHLFYQDVSSPSARDFGRRGGSLGTVCLCPGFFFK